MIKLYCFLTKYLCQSGKKSVACTAVRITNQIDQPDHVQEIKCIPCPSVRMSPKWNSILLTLSTLVTLTSVKIISIANNKLPAIVLFPEPKLKSPLQLIMTVCALTSPRKEFRRKKIMKVIIVFWIKLSNVTFD